jgi:hypothetical protein
MSLVLSVAISAVISTFGPGIMPQNDGNSRPYKEWTKQDVTRLLNDSPWAKTQTVRIAPRRQMRSVAGQVSATPGSEGAVPTDGKAALGGAEEAIDYSFTVRLRSALPIREAIVRLVQLDSNYDRMPPAEKKSLDTQTRELLECHECADHYVISVGFGSTNSQGADPIYNWFRGHSAQSLKGYIYIQNDRGDRRDLAAFIPPRVPGDEAFFLFARKDKQGKPLLTVDHKKLLLRMSDANANSVTNFNLDVSRMVVNGRVEF